MAPLFTGVAVALVTMFDEDGRVLADATAEHAARLAERGVRAIIIAGTTGEGPRLDPSDRRVILAAVRPAVARSVPIIVGTGHKSAAEAVQLTRDARDGGASGVLVFPADDAALGAFYADVRSAAGELTVLAYHFPKHYRAIPVGALAGLDVDGLKDSEGDRARLSEEAGTWDRAVYTGSAPLLSRAAGLGATGAILAIANLLPVECARAFAGDEQTQSALMPVHETLVNGGVAAIKRALARECGSPAHMRAAWPQPAV